MRFLVVGPGFNSRHATLHCPENSKHISPAMKLCSLFPNFYIHIQYLGAGNAGQEYPVEVDHPQECLQRLDERGARKFMDGGHVGRDYFVHVGKKSCVAVSDRPVPAFLRPKKASTCIQTGQRGLLWPFSAQSRRWKGSDDTLSVGQSWRKPFTRPPWRRISAWLGRV
jgi:hypothetical protein